MKKTIRKNVCIGLGLYSVFTLLFIFNPYSVSFNNILATFVLFVSGVLVYKCRNNSLLLIMSLFISYSNYSIVVGIYYFPELRPKYLYPQIIDVQVYGIGIAVLFLFMVALLAFLPRKVMKMEREFSHMFIKTENSNPLIFIAATLLFVVVIILGYSRTNGGRGSSSAIYEYNIIFLIVMFYFSGNDKWKKGLCCLCAVLYVCTSLLNGTRIEALACILVVFFCMLKKKLSKVWLIVGFILGLVLLNFIGIFRGNYTSLLLGLEQSVSNLVETKLVFDTCTHAYFPALCMIEQFKNYTLSNGMHFLSKFLLTIIKGQSRVTDGDLISYVSQKYYHNYGGVTVGFFYVWFSYLGSLIFAFIVGKYIEFINSRNNSDSSIEQCAILYVISTIPRWYLYGPWSLTRGVILCVLVFWIVKKIDILMRRKKI